MGSARELGERLLALEVRARQVASEMAEVIVEAEQSGAIAQDGFRSVRSWVQAVCNVSPRLAKERVRIARAAAAHADVKQGLATGVVGVEQIDEIARLHAHPRCRQHLPTSVGSLVELAERLEYPDFLVAVARFRLLAHPDGTCRSHDNARAGRGASGVFVGTEFVFRAEGDVLAGTEIINVFRRFVEAEFAKDWQATKAAHGDEACRALMPRTHRQRCFDAFHTMALAAAGSGVVAVPEPLVNLMIDLDTFTRFSETLLGQETSELDSTALQRVRCETVEAVPVDPHRVVASAITGRVRRVVTDPHGRIIDFGRRRRLFTGGAREVAQLAGFRCDHRGCDIPVTWCHIDHLLEWMRDHGGTNGDNGRPRCHRHNNDKHRQGWRVTQDRHGVTHTYRSDGTEIAPRPAGPARCRDDDDEPD